MKILALLLLLAASTEGKFFWGNCARRWEKFTSIDKKLTTSSVEPSLTPAAHQPPPSHDVFKEYSYSAYKDYMNWLSDFRTSQQQFCGHPAKPLKFSEDQKTLRKASYRSWPWMVSLYRSSTHVMKFISLYPEQFQENAMDLLKILEDADSGHSCGGTLLSNEFVLTAAHCVNYKSANKHLGDPQMIENLLINDFFDKCKIAGETERCQADFTEFKISNNGFNLAGTYRNDSSQWELWIGTHQTPPDSNSFTAEYLKILEVKNIIRHPQFNWNNGLHGDLAILQLKKPLESFSREIRPICLTDVEAMDSSSGGAYKDCALAGWGGDIARATGKIVKSKWLQDVQLHILNRLQCWLKTRKYPAFQGGDININTREQICAVENDYGDPKEEGIRTKPCYGDSGSPLICKYPDDRWYQIGVYSHGKSINTDSCELPNAPDLFTNVPHYIDWITETMWLCAKYNCTKDKVDRSHIPSFLQSFWNFG